MLKSTIKVIFSWVLVNFPDEIKIYAKNKLVVYKVLRATFFFCLVLFLTVKLLDLLEACSSLLFLQVNFGLRNT